MRASSLLFGTLVLLPLSLGAQESRTADVPRGVTVRPADVVAERVRRVLFGDPDRASLTELAEIIPETSIARSERVATRTVSTTSAVSEEAGSEEGVREQAVSEEPAVREQAVSEDAVPESAASDVAAEVVPALASSDADGADGPVSSETAGDVIDVVAMGPEWTSEGLEPATVTPATTSWADRLRTVNVENLFRLLAGVFVLVATATLLRRRGAGSIYPSASGARSGSVGDARSLVAKGVPLHEVTRRTGLGRDAIALLAQREPS